MRGDTMTKTLLCLMSLSTELSFCNEWGVDLGGRRKPFVQNERFIVFMFETAFFNVTEQFPSYQDTWLWLGGDDQNMRSRHKFLPGKGRARQLERYVVDSILKLKPGRLIISSHTALLNNL